MTTPTDAEINRAMAEAIGWDCLESTQCFHWAHDRMSASVHGNGWRSPVEVARKDTHGAQYPPQFCHDRNTLPEILNAVEAAGKQRTMAVRLDKDISKGVVESAWIMWRLPMREIVLVALRAIGKWPADWNVPE